MTIHDTHRIRARRRFRLASALAALAMAPGLAGAQTVPPAVAPALDPARVAAAQQVAAKIFPAGIYKRMFGETFTKMMGSMPDMMADLPIREIAQIGGLSEEKARQLGDAKIGEVMEIYDPHWRERLQLTMTSMTSVLGDMMAEFEPRVRAALARGYAREFSLAELGEIDRFLTTPTGAHFAEKQFAMFMDPEMMKEMTAFMPEMMKRLPDLIAQAKKATASLPPARKLKDLTPAERRRLAELLEVPDDKLNDAGDGPK